LRIRDAHIDEEPYNLVPLTDMVFNLLIFFMAATTFTQIEKDLSVQLPKAGGFQTLSAAPKQIVINIRQDGSTYVDGRQRTDAELSDLVTRAVKADPGREVLVRVDERSIMQHFARVASICRRAGVHPTKIGYLDSGGGAKPQ
jgi:biopolymer transport protein ExbD